MLLSLENNYLLLLLFYDAIHWNYAILYVLNPGSPFNLKIFFSGIDIPMLKDKRFMRLCYLYDTIYIYIY